MKPQEICAYWYSEKHAEHYASMIDHAVCKNFITINGIRRTYTAMSSLAPLANEPYEGAIQTFPDYKLLGFASMATVRIDGYWNFSKEVGDRMRDAEYAEMDDYYDHAISDYDDSDL